MHKNLILVSIAIFFFSGFSLARADVIINEFVSDPDSGPEWIELLNTSSSEVNLSDWKWTELIGPGTDTEHEGSPKSLTGVISAGGVFVFETTSALNNLGDSISLYNGTNLENRVTFGKVDAYSKDIETPAKGKSGALISGVWKTNQDPTKGTINPASTTSDDNEEDEEKKSSGDDNNENKETPPSSSGSSSSSGNKSITDAKTKTTIVKKIKAQITAPTLAYVGIPIIFQGMAIGLQGEQLFNGKYFWNFGDGDSREVKIINTDKFPHTYFYPGEHPVILEYYPNQFSEIPDATEKIIIKVVVPTVFISSVGDENDFFVELSNTTDYAIDLSNWFLTSNQKSFSIPRNTILASKKKIIISSRISNFSVQDKNTLKLMTPQRAIVFDYSSSSSRVEAGINERILAGAEKTVTIKMSKNLNNNNLSNNETKNEIPISTSQNLVSALSSGALEDSKSLYSSPIILFTSLIFISAGAGSVYFIRRKNIIPQAGNDFEILDE